MASDHTPAVVRSVAAAMLALSWVTVSLRVYVRTRLIKAFGSDDWLAVATLASSPRSGA